MVDQSLESAPHFTHSHKDKVTMSSEKPGLEERPLEYSAIPGSSQMAETWNRREVFQSPIDSACGEPIEPVYRELVRTVAALT